MPEKIKIYIDGSCNNQADDRIGGYGFWMEFRGSIKSVCGGAEKTSSNRMEMVAMIGALKTVTEKIKFDVEVYSDSKYLIDGINKWSANWIKNGWKSSENKSVKNKGLWKIILEEKQKFRNITFSHIPREQNKRADQLANNGRLLHKAMLETDENKSLELLRSWLNQNNKKMS